MSAMCEVLKWVKAMIRDEKEWLGCLYVCVWGLQRKDMKYGWGEASTLPFLRATSPTMPTSVSDQHSPTFSCYVHPELLPLLTQLSSCHQAGSRLLWQHPRFYTQVRLLPALAMSLFMPCLEVGERMSGRITIFHNVNIHQRPHSQMANSRNCSSYPWTVLLLEKSMLKEIGLDFFEMNC